MKQIRLQHPLISVVVPIRSLRNKYRNLQELFLQDLTCFEIILVLDKSDDFTRQIVKRIKEEAQTGLILDIHGDYGNPGAARNAGIGLATCDWICFWDADDLPEPQVVLALLDNFRDVDILVGQYRIMDWNTKKESSKKYLDLDKYSVAMNPGLWRHVFKRSLVKGVLFPELTMAEDQVYLATAYLRAKVIAFTESNTYNYFQNVPLQLTGSAIDTTSLSKARQHIVNLMQKSLSFSDLNFLMIIFRNTSSRIPIIEAKSADKYNLPRLFCGFRDVI